MLRIRRIYDALFPRNLASLEQVIQTLHGLLEIKEQDVTAMVASFHWACHLW